jgi:hypothetical protein
MDETIAKKSERGRFALFPSFSVVIYHQSHRNQNYKMVLETQKETHQVHYTYPRLLTDFVTDSPERWSGSDE